jgi:hypothetical protein
MRLMVRARAWARSIAALALLVAVAACSGSSGGSCLVPTDFFCFDLSGPGYAGADATAACAQAASGRDGGVGVYQAGPCSRTGRVGTCTRDPGTARETIETDYDGGPLSLADFRARCGGTWTSP